jgi:transcriptional regulator GlxA family with amidase domain
MTDTIEARYARQQSLQIGILVFPDVEVLDFAGPFEVFSVASRIAGRHTGVPTPFAVSLIGATGDVVCARHGMGVLPHASFASAPALDLLVVPGGLVTQPLNDPATLAWIARQQTSAALTASVCTGAFILAKLGLLDGLAVTTHWEDIPDLRASHPQLTVCEGAPWVDQGAIVTSAGISAGIGMSLHLVGRILGLPMAMASARQMEFDWTPQSA